MDFSWKNLLDYLRAVCYPFRKFPARERRCDSEKKTCVSPSPNLSNSFKGEGLSLRGGVEAN